ncbi:hypothetical protein MKW94_019352 [Papaver nudicaule]|uniref:Uncharacterized protein n=1 Tax=Papaver nudicaule TaxID=74823 RepID=A0AA41W359_PAPNU|nr:hypothetical protein [Papaver nudicaule]
MARIFSTAFFFVMIIMASFTAQMAFGIRRHLISLQLTSYVERGSTFQLRS